MTTHAECRIHRKIELQIKSAVEHGDLPRAVALARNRATGRLTQNEQITLIEKALSRKDIETAADMVNEYTPQEIIEEIFLSCLKQGKKHFVSLCMVFSYLKRTLTKNEKEKIYVVCSMQKWTDKMTKKRFRL